MKTSVPGPRSQVIGNAVHSLQHQQTALVLAQYCFQWLTEGLFVPLQELLKQLGDIQVSVYCSQSRLCRMMIGFRLAFFFFNKSAWKLMLMVKWSEFPNARGKQIWKQNVSQFKIYVCCNDMSEEFYFQRTSENVEFLQRLTAWLRVARGWFGKWLIPQCNEWLTPRDKCL